MVTTNNAEGLYQAFEARRMEQEAQTQAAARWARDMDAAETAIGTFEKARAALYRNDASGTPQPVYTDHAEREAGLLAVLDATFEGLDNRAKEDAAEARELIEREANADPSTKLSAADLAVANSRRAFIQEDCQTLAMPDLLARIRAALATNDRPALFLLARYGAQRIEREQSAREAGGKRINPADALLEGEVGKVVREAADTFVDRRALDGAAARLKAAQQQQASLTRRWYQIPVNQQREMAAARKRASW